MRRVSLLMVATTLASASGCLLLHRPGADGAAPADTDLPATEETDPDADTDPPTDDADTDEPTADTDPSTADTDSATAPVDTAPDTDLTVGPNHAPTVGVPALGPTPAFNSSTLTCAATASDPDGTTPTVSYGWLNVSSGLDLGAGANKPLTSSLALPGDTVRCAATASDGTLTATGSASVVLTNRAPVVGMPGITPSPATVTSTLSCAATTSDPDGTTPVVTYAWTNVTKATSLGSSSSVVLSAGTASGGDKLRCTVTATDGALSGSSYGEVVLAVVAPTILGAWKTIPSGTFTMGCAVGRDDVGVTCSAQTNELPTHSVTLTHSFWMMQSEVTQGMWLGLMGNSPSYFFPCGSTCPVEQVNWWEAASFANAASAAEGLSSCYALTGCTGNASSSSLTCTGVTVNTVGGSPYDCAGYRLPTEAEWEYAARGGTSTAYSGSAVVGDVAWTIVNSGSRSNATCGKSQNGYGLCDMSGNVREWTWDWYASAYTAGAQSNPAGPASGSLRVYRGGGWGFGASAARVAERSGYYPDRRTSDLGFRLLRSVP